MSWAPPPFIQQAHNDALAAVAPNHYQLPRGNARLRKALSKYLSPSYKLGRELDPNTEIQVTAGANEGAFFASFLLFSAFPHVRRRIRLMILRIPVCAQVCTPSRRPLSAPTTR